MKEIQQKKKLRGFASDGPLVRISKTMSYILRHGAKDQGLQMRPDGFVRVTDLVSHSYHCTALRVEIHEWGASSSPSQ